MPERLSDADLEQIRERFGSAPAGPYYTKLWVGFCVGVHTHCILKPDGDLAWDGRAPGVVSVLSLPHGRTFVQQSWDDVRRLLDHIEAQQLKELELRARIQRLEKGGGTLEP
jgi:hypothetical protein